MALTKITQHVLGVDSDAISEGSTNLFHTTARARGAISVAGGYLTYSSGEVALTQSNIVGSLASQSLSPANITLSGYLRGPSSFTIDPATHGNDTGTVVIAGNLQVDGTTTTINSTTMTVDDLNMVLASGAADSAAANGAGLTIDGASATMLYTHATTSFDFNKPVNVTGAFSASGNVGIGTGSPATDLQIGDYTDNAETLTFATASDQTGRINFYNANASEGASIRVTGGGAGAKMYFANRYDSDADKVTFDLVNGKVGIGTNSPATAIHSHSASGSPELRLTTGQDSGTPTTQIGYSAGSGYFLRLADAANNEDIMLRTYGDSYFRHGPLHIGTTDSISSSSELLSVYSAGTGNTKLRNSSDSYVPLYIENASTTANTFQPFITMQSGGGNRGYVGVRYTDSVAGFSGQGGISLRTGAASLDGSTEKLFIDGGGDLFLGMNSGHHAASGRRVFEMSGTSSALIGFDINGSYSTYMFDSGTSGTFEINHPNEVYLNADSKLRFATGTNVEALTITNNQDVGIGTIAPARRLHIFQTEGSVGAKHAAIQFGGYASYKDRGPMIAAYRATGNSNDQGFIFSTYNASTGVNDRYRMDHAGKHEFFGVHQGDSVGHFIFSNQQPGTGTGDSTSANCTLMVKNGSAQIQILAWSTLGARIGTRGGGWNSSGTQDVYFTTGDTVRLTMSHTTGVVTGNLNDTSDERLKKDITTIGDTTTKLKQLNPVNFKWKENDTVSEGFIAQEVEAIFPELVNTGPVITGDQLDSAGQTSISEVKSVNTVGLLAKAIKTIQELEARIATLEG